MGQNLKARLALIRESGKKEEKPGEVARKTSAVSKGQEPLSMSDWSGWSEAGFMTLKREKYMQLPFSLPAAFPETLAIVVPDLVHAGHIPSPGEFLFFDLETTGLSGGAGTVAFLAAFGRFIPIKERDCNSPGLVITQYLLLDYPGEPDFIENIVKELSVSFPPVLVSFNGKCFDSQILKNRCLMNGIMVPRYLHADLLHPARRLWKSRLPDCSQATIEVSVLGLERADDISGARAPDIWFSFLRSGINRELLLVCEHNVKDICGLASLFLVLGKIAAAPLESRKFFKFDEEAFALIWHKASKNRELYQNCGKIAELLLKNAAENGFPRAAFALALEYFKKGHSGKGRSLMLKLVEDNSWKNTADHSGKEKTAVLRAAALRTLAMDAQWRLKDLPLALGYTESALACTEISANFRKELETRYSRLEKKINEPTV